MSTFERGASPTLSMREKSLLKRRINKEHSSNFRAGYVHINEEQLHKTGIRGRKRYVVYVVTVLLVLAVLVNITITATILGVLRIGQNGMQALELLPGGRLLRFLEDSDMGDVYLTEPVLGSLPDGAIQINGEEGGQVQLKIKQEDGGSGPTVTVKQDETVVRAPEGLQVLDPRTGKIVFSTDRLNQKFPENVTNFKADQVTANKIKSDAGESLNIVGSQKATLSGGRGVSMMGREVVIMAQDDINVSSAEDLILNGAEGTHLKFYDGLPIKDVALPPRDDVMTYKLCVHSPDGTVFPVPWDSSCDVSDSEPNNK